VARSAGGIAQVKPVDIARRGSRPAGASALHQMCIEQQIRSGGMYAARRNFQEASLSRRMKISFLSDFLAVTVRSQENLPMSPKS